MKKQIADDIKANLKEMGFSLTDLQCGELVETALESIVAQAMRDGKCGLHKFGVFQIHEQAPRTARNPHTGESIAVPAKKVLRFRTSGVIKERINQ